MKSKPCSSTCPELPRKRQVNLQNVITLAKKSVKIRRSVIFQLLKSRSGVGERSKQSASPKPCSPKLPRTYSYGMLLSSPGFIKHQQTASNIRTSCARRPHTDQYEPDKKSVSSSPIIHFLLGSTSQSSTLNCGLAECCLGRANRISCRAHNEAGPRIRFELQLKSVCKLQELDGAAKPRPSIYHFYHFDIAKKV